MKINHTNNEKHTAAKGHLSLSRAWALTSRVALSLVLAASTIPAEALSAYAEELAGADDSQVTEVVTDENVSGEGTDSADVTSGDPTVNSVDDTASTNTDPSSEALPAAGDAGADDQADDEDAEDSQIEAEYGITDDGLERVYVGGEAAASRAAAAAALADLTILSTDDAEDVADEIFSVNAEDGTEAEGTLPKSADGTDIDSLVAVWRTADTIDNGDDELLYLKPDGNNPVSAVIRLSYALSGEHDYEAGDITITVPKSVFTSRTGSSADQLQLSIPTAPSTSGNWNYSIVGDEVIITNVKSMKAASQGYLDLAYQGVVPSSVVDMDLHDFQASIEVVTHLGTLLGATSNELQAQVDTESVINGATKRVSTSYPIMYTADEMAAKGYGVPEGYEDETGYVVVDYYMNPVNSNNNNQPFSLELLDTRTDEYDGFIISATSEDAQTTEATVHTDKFVQGTMSSTYAHVMVAYPLSQFEPDTVYTFTNHVDYTLTETDPEKDDDPQRVTTAGADAEVKWSYTEPVVRRPEGSFRVSKYGGDYLDILNLVRDGEDIDISYSLYSIGYLMPWTLGDGLDYRVLSNYGKKDVTLTTSESGLTLSGVTLTEGTDYDFSSYTFYMPSIYTATAINLDEDGNLTTLRDGSFTYAGDYDTSHIPDITLEVQLEGSDEWVPAAVSSWQTGSMVVTPLLDGFDVSGAKVMLPANVTNIRTTTTTNVGGISYGGLVGVTLHASDWVSDVTDAAYESSYSPRISVVNAGVMDVTQDETIYTGRTSAADIIYGYTDETRAELSKSGRVTGYDFDARVANISYSATLDIKSFIANGSTYRRAVANGDIEAVTSGVWYDLLPEGITPDLSSIRVRSGDSVTNAYTIENYQGSGRTMLVVEVELTPVPSTYYSGSNTFYKDSPTISFNATQSFDAIRRLGGDDGEYTSVSSHNVIAFQSTSSDHMGTVPGYVGETDDPTSGNNYGSRDAFKTADEMSWMTDLDPKTDDPVFVYAGASTTQRILSSAETGLLKEVSVNNDGRYSTGIYEGNREANARDVYEGGVYSYRIGTTPSAGTTASNVIMYDSLENFYPIAGNEDVDEADNRWSGTFVGVDVSPLEELGAKPVVYYSTVDNLRLSNDTEDRVNPIEENVDLSNSNVWVRADEFTGDLSEVAAVAVDITEAADGSAFTLDENMFAHFFINMSAPQGEEAESFIESDAHAFNNAYMASTTTNVKTGMSEEDFVRKDYTKVGLSEYKITVIKDWDDDNDRDGIRPDSAVVRLYYDGEPYDYNGDGQVNDADALVLSDDNDWTDAFHWLPYFHDDGTKIVWSVREEATGYQMAIAFDQDGNYVITNRHTPEKVAVSGAKTWVGDTDDVRPTSIRVALYADGTLYRTTTVRADEDGNWTYSFENLPKYRDGGVEIEYTVQEQQVDNAYVSEVTETEDGYDITNTYHPYGDITLSKEVLNGTSATEGQRFDFTVVLTDSEGEPDQGTYEYVTSDGREGTFTSGDTIALGDDETLTIKEVPAGTQWTISEELRDGYTLASSSGETGTVAANSANAATFTNRYSASISISLEADKTLIGRSLTKSLFGFTLTDVDTGEVVMTARNGRGTDRDERDMNGNIVSDADVTFGSLTYTQADDGRTYTYILAETDEGKNGYSYDSTTYTVVVEPHDNGDGTMHADVTYYDSDGNPVDGGDVDFANYYYAHGSYTPSVFKTLTGFDLADGQFTFELAEVTDGGIWPLYQATNDISGNVVFSELNYDQASIGHTYTYAIYEVNKTDNTVVYDEHFSLFSITVSDFGMGELSFATQLDEVEVDCWNHQGDDCALCGGDGIVSGGTDSYLFTNSYKNGGLDIVKTVDGDTDQVFTFRVVLSNPYTDVVVDTDAITVEPYEPAPGEDAGDAATDDAAASVTEVDPSMAAAKADPDDESFLDAMWSAFTSLLTPTTAHADEARTVVASGTQGSYSWTLYSDGEVVLSGSVPVTGSSSWPFYQYRSQITTISAAPGTTVTGWMTSAFANYSALKKVDFSNVTWIAGGSGAGMASGFTGVRLTEFYAGSGGTWNNIFKMLDDSVSTLEVVDLSGVRFDINQNPDKRSNEVQQSAFQSGVGMMTSIQSFAFNDSYTDNFWSSIRNRFPASDSDGPIQWVFEDGSGNVTELTGGPSNYSWSQIQAMMNGTGKGAIKRVTNTSVTYDGNGATMGSMAPYESEETEDYTVLASAYKWPGHRFTGWNTKADGTGTSYSPGDVIPNCGKITLYAQWESTTSVTQGDDGSYIVTMGANEVMHFADDLPAGTTYQVYELTPAGWSLISSSDTSGTIEPTETSTASFHNEYTPDATTASIVASKTLDGAAADGFEFGLYSIDPDTQAETLVGETVAASSGTVAFPTLSFSGAGTYNYVIREIVGGDSTINYDTEPEYVSVTVTDDGQGNLAATVNYDSADADAGVASFKNTTKPGSLSISKTATGALSSTSSGQTFSFTVTIAGEAYKGSYTVGGETRTTDDGTITLAGSQTAVIDGLPAGATYRVVENDLPSGWTQSEANNDTGRIVSTQTVNASFVNTYSATGSVTLSGTKILAGSAMVAGQFTFELVDQNEGHEGEVIQRVTNEVPGDDGSAAFAFDDLTYTTPGEYEYSVREYVPIDEGATETEDGWVLDGVVYDQTIRRVVVQVSDNGDGTLSAVIDDTQSDGLEFTNHMTTHDLTIAKVATNDLGEDSLLSSTTKGQTFSVRVTLKDSTGAPATGVATSGGAAVADGDVLTIAAGESLTLVGLPYGGTWSVEEVDIPSGWTLASSENTQGTVTGDGNEVTLTNTYDATGSAVLQARKTFDGEAPAEGAYTFRLYEGDELIETVTNDAEGNVTFRAISYGLDDLGEHSYRIVEVAGGDGGVAYDADEVTATVTVTDNGDGTLGTSVRYGDKTIFENLTAVELARTGGAGVGVLGVGVLGFGLVPYLRRRREE